MNEGECSTRLGLLGWPAEGEELEIMRDIALCRLTGCHFHAQHVTTARGSTSFAPPKPRGCPSPASHAAPSASRRLDDRRGLRYELQGEPAASHEADVAALRAGLADGTVDAGPKCSNFEKWEVTAVDRITIFFKSYDYENAEGGHSFTTSTMTATRWSSSTGAMASWAATSGSSAL